ncbi:MAG: YqaE/Pmp3 family membrane protein [Alphaproteobacteria bacterium]|nr:MAG: YqaE/Pmp3 family membrane protein [Alphaproteobacteria bacterium]
MLYLVAFFIPPLALLLAGKPFQCIISGIFWILSWFLFAFLGAGFLLWLILAVHAIMVVRDRNTRKMMEEIHRGRD